MFPLSPRKTLQKPPTTPTRNGTPQPITPPLPLHQYAGHLQKIR